MSQSYTNLLYHIIFSTKDRRPLINPAYESRLYDYIGGTIRGVGGISLELNGTARSRGTAVVWCGRCWWK